MIVIKGHYVSSYKPDTNKCDPKLDVGIYNNIYCENKECLGEEGNYWKRTEKMSQEIIK